ncbi:hypothetical protein ACIQTZ_04255 [Paenarthrobacter sp. NPDC090520]
MVRSFALTNRIACCRDAEIEAGASALGQSHTAGVVNHGGTGGAFNGQ